MKESLPSHCEWRPEPSIPFVCGKLVTHQLDAVTGVVEGEGQMFVTFYVCTEHAIEADFTMFSVVYNLETNKADIFEVMV